MLVHVPLHVPILVSSEPPVLRSSNRTEKLRCRCAAKQSKYVFRCLYHSLLPLSDSAVIARAHRSVIQCACCIALPSIPCSRWCFLSYAWYVFMVLVRVLPLLRGGMCFCCFCCLFLEVICDFVVFASSSSRSCMLSLYSWSDGQDCRDAYVCVVEQWSGDAVTGVLVPCTNDSWPSLP